MESLMTQYNRLFSMVFHVETNLMALTHEGDVCYLAWKLREIL